MLADADADADADEGKTARAWLFGTRACCSSSACSTSIYTRSSQSAEDQPDHRR
jgi:hypothetical protein